MPLTSIYCFLNLTFIKEIAFNHTVSVKEQNRPQRKASFST